VQVRDRQGMFEGPSRGRARVSTWRTAGQPELVDGMWASSGIFEVLGVPAILGRTFTPADDRRGC
jgi:hypothetical protein